MKKLIKKEFDDLIINNRAQFKLIEEQKTELDDNEFYSPLMTGMMGRNKIKTTGKYNFMIFVNAPKNLTGLDNSNEKIAQQWELIEQVSIGGENCLQFQSWGQPPLMKYEGNLMVIPTEFFHIVFQRLNQINPTLYSMTKFRNTIGLENVNI